MLHLGIVPEVYGRNKAALLASLPNSNDQMNPLSSTLVSAVTVRELCQQIDQSVRSVTRPVRLYKAVNE